MRKYLALIGVNFRVLLSNFTSSSTKNKNKKAASGIGAILLMIGLSSYLSIIYSVLLGEQLAAMDMINLLPVLMAFASALMSVMFTALAASGMVFGSKDMDLMLSLPLSSFSVMLSKIMALYIENFVFCIFMMLPSGVVYLMQGGAGGIMFIVRLIFCTIFLPILPTIASLIIGFAIAWIGGRAKHKKILTSVAYLVFFCVIMYFAMGMNSFMGKLLQNGAAIDKAFSTWLYPIGLMRDAMFGNYFAMVAFVIILVLPFLAIVYLFSTKYKKMLTVLSSHYTRNDYKMGSLKSSGQFKALLKKEFGRFFGTPMYIFNTGIGAIMSVGAGVAAIIFKKEIDIMMTEFGGNMMPILVLFVAFIVSTLCPASVSVSLEGKTLWILKEAPINPRSFFLAKAGVNAVLIWGTGIITTPMLWYAFGLNMAQGLIMFALFFTSGVLVPLLGLGTNMLFPKMDGVNDVVIIKQSLSALIGIFAPMIVAGIGAIAYVNIGDNIGDLAFFTCTCIILLALSALIYKLLVTKGSEKLLRL